MELMQAHQQWSKRPNDERFLSLDDLAEHTANQMECSKGVVVSSRSITVEPTDNRGLVVRGPSNSFTPTHWAFNQLCQRVGAPPDYLRSHPAPMVADSLNFDYQYKRDIEDIGLLLYQNGSAPELRAVTGPKYGRIWNANFVEKLQNLFGDGVTGRWHIPGEFNKSAPITKQNTTLYAGDRDMFVFLCDGEHDVEIKARRNGQTGRMQRGFFAWNSEVGSSSFGLGTFLFDYMCCNHIVWGVSGFDEVRIRHTVSAPDRWLEEVMPALEIYANASTKGITEAIDQARASRLDKVDEFLANRFGPRMVNQLKTVHALEEDRPIETVYDAVNAATAVAKGIPWISQRLDLEREAGKLLIAA
jgi:hypothetical protein